jgi:hypothetical protein
MEMISMHFPFPSLTSHSLGRDTSFSNLFYDYFHVCSSSSVTDQESYTSKTTGEIINKEYFILGAIIQRKRREKFRTE